MFVCCALCAVCWLQLVRVECFDVLYVGCSLLFVDCCLLIVVC